jgi:hypothetical protein
MHNWEPIPVYSQTHCILGTNTWNSVVVAGAVAGVVGHIHSFQNIYVIYMKPLLIFFT